MKISLLFITIFFSSLLLSKPQERSTTGMKIIVVVEAKSNKVPGIIRLDTFQQMMVSQVLEKYSGCHFYMGNLKGNYALIDLNIIPMENAEITMYTEREFFRYGNYLGAKNLDEGDNFNLGKILSKVTSNKKGELHLKINPN